MILDISKHAKFYKEYLDFLILRATGESILLDNRKLDPTSRNNTDIYRNCLYAMRYLFEQYDGGRIYPNHIKKIAAMVNDGPESDIKDYRRINVMINGGYFTPPSPREIPGLMMNLLENYYKVWVDLDVFEKEALFHIKLVRIQPFDDGNKRTARILMNYNLFKQNKSAVIIPWGEYARYYDFISREDVHKLAKFLERLSNEEFEFMKEYYKRIVGEEYVPGSSFQLK